MTLEELNDLIRQKQEEIKNLKRQRDVMMNHDCLKEEREAFYELATNQLKRLKKMDVEKQRYIEKKYLSDHHLNRGYEHFWAARIWERFRIKAIKPVKGKKGLISCTREEYEMVFKRIKEFEKEFEKDMED